MAKEAEIGGSGRGTPWRIIGWSIPVLLLLLPLVAMQLTDEVNWTAFDFVFAAVLFGTVGFAFEFIVRRSTSLAYRFGAALAVIAGFLTIWANGAVGMIGDEDNPYNLLFLGVIVLALAGTVVARFRPTGMACAMAVAALAQLVISLAGMPADARGGIFSAIFTGLWLLSAAFFWKAAQDEKAAPSG